MSQHAEQDYNRLDLKSVGERAWDALRQQGIPPTPRSFEVFYALFDGGNRPLVSHVRECEANGQLLTAGYIDALHRDYIDRGEDSARVAAGADDLADVAQGIVEQVTRDGDAIRAYGGTLDHWRTHLNASSGTEELLRAVTMLTAETEGASARNRVLEAQLSASVGRIARLREDLLQVRQEAATDALTGIANRRAFDSKLRRAIKDAVANPSSRFALLMIDVDHFKRFNDEHGHKTGDQVLRRVARMLADNVKGRDTAARFGGEEFVILLAGADHAVARTVAWQMCERLAAQVLMKRGTGETVGRVTISIGVAEHRAGESGADLIERSDAALYEAKRTGRNRVCVAEATTAAA
ncbi:GGDEF domain-containing protein [Methylobacterium sp. WL30]|uniref:GGDEF domain-containing protein n=1 Tax=unclassified Methylobacterium TaxID=2615210 RepID=UPI0011C89F74|nr:MULTISPECIES: GGDEF domain-containing protein [unclassified Methylobacterium]TXN41550.1 GGDEF domain-containing protein [Methylobacterium sp. WL93]TXN52441.1 GGDEF domain-containing protein [Methylobacterium sp. WL119]TXN69755.1 GGDEF domain-containing protein [Methylobacterium sp. WL30]